MLVLAARTILAAFGEDENRLALHGEAMAQCAPLDAQALGLAVQEMAELRETMTELLMEMKSKPRGLLSKKQVATRLGVTERTIDRLIADGVLRPGRMVGSRPRWTEADVEAAVQ